MVQSAEDRVEYGEDRSIDTIPEGNFTRLPDEFAGLLMVFRTFDKVSYGLIMDGIRPARIDDRLKAPERR